MILQSRCEIHILQIKKLKFREITGTTQGHPARKGEEHWVLSSGLPDSKASFPASRALKRKLWGVPASMGGYGFHSRPQGQRCAGLPLRPGPCGMEPAGSHLLSWRGGAGVEVISEEVSLARVLRHAVLLGLRCWFLLIPVHWELFNRIFSF